MCGKRQLPSYRLVSYSYYCIKQNNTRGSGGMPPDEKQIATMRLNFGAFQDLIIYS